MNRRRAAMSIALCIILSCAFSASSATAQGTTAFSCVEGGSQDFADPHCAEEVKAGTGEFSHSEIGEGLKTSTVLTNEKTGNETKEAKHTILKGKAFGVTTEFDCATVNGTSTIENVSKGVDGVMAAESKNVVISLTNCSVLKPTKCAAAEPVELSATSATRVGLGAGKNTMGVEFKPLEKVLGTITYVNKGAETCILNGKKLASKERYSQQGLAEAMKP
jgi:hypothetical protein